MKRYRLCFLGFGNVGRALARLLVAKSADLRDNYGIDWEITGVATRRMGWRAREDAIDVAALLAGTDDTPTQNSITDWLAQAKPDVVFETTSLNPETGQPAIDYLRASLQAGAHTITANKAPIVYAFDELNLHRVSLTVFAYNERALRTYRRLGFVEEGRQRERLLRFGRRWDMVFMSIFNGERP